jgi:GNAT superfamily N-acetyltransferase
VPHDDARVRAWAEEVQRRLGLEAFDVWPSTRSGRPALKLEMIRVPKAARRRGVGTSAMEELVAFADRHQLPVLLTPAVPGDPGGPSSRARLVRFYRRFGFVENKGRAKDFTVSEGMYREPRPRRANPSGLRIQAVMPYVSPATRPLTPAEARVREVAIGLKTGDRAAVLEAAERMAPLVPVGSLLVPVPSSTPGSFGGLVLLVEELALLTGGRPVALVHRARPIRSQRERRHAGLRGWSAAEQARTMIGTAPPPGASVVLVDNVVATGATMAGAWAAMGWPRAIGLAYAGGPEVLHPRRA